jgi:hypothetical protein
MAADRGREGLMALADYYLCDNCEGKTFYDAELNYQACADGSMVLPGVGSMKVLCEKCAENFEIVVIPREEEF